MISLHTIAHAKLNLTLDVIGRRSDGYHNLQMIMQEIALGDELTLILGTCQPWSILCDSNVVPCDDMNLAVFAARLFFEKTKIDCNGLTIQLKKITPVCAGLGGGSADGAAVLRLLQEHYNNPLSDAELYRLAEKTGSDVPFALFGGTALAEEKGQLLTALPPLPSCSILLCKPPFPVSTPELFRQIDTVPIIHRPDTKDVIKALENRDLLRLSRKLTNVFMPVVSKSHPELAQIETTMREYGAMGVSMSGSGPTMFGLFQNKANAEEAFYALKPVYEDTFVTEPVCTCRDVGVNHDLL